LSNNVKIYFVIFKKIKN